MAVIFRSIYKATRNKCHVEEMCLCPKIRELWIQMIEGNDATDDVWFWMDGDEQWLREHLKDFNLGKTAEYHKKDWVDSQSALRRRIRKPRNHAGGSEFAKRICSATPEQHPAVICWLTFNSSHVKDLTIELGRTPLGMFEVGDMIAHIRGIVCSAWDAFPASDSAAW